MSETTVQPPSPLGNRTLLPNHRAQMHASGLTDETIAAAGIFSITDGDEAGKLLGWSGPAPVPAIVFPYFDQSGGPVMHILRPDVPRLKDGKAVKYESPVGIGPRLYFAPKSIMAADVHDPNVPLFVVEGIKKALKMAQSAALVLSAQGTTVWHNTSLRKSSGDRVLHADFDGIPLDGRRVYVTFDGGDTSVNAPVIEAEAQFAKMLLHAGADVHLLRVPHQHGVKMGIDDYLVTQPDATAALFELCVSSLVADPLSRARAVAQHSDPARAALDLLHDLSFVAALKVRDAATLDVVAAGLHVAKIKKASLDEAVEAFSNRLRASARKAPTASPTDEGIRAEAESLLASPDLIEKFWASVSADGVVGEQSSALTLLLAGVTRKMKEPLHIAVKAASSVGKSHLVRKVMKHMPPEDVEDISEMTPQALLYLPNALDGKIVIVAEHEGAERAQYPMRLAMSERKLTLWAPEKVSDEGGGTKIVTQRREISCRASFVTTTTQALLLEDNETRFIEVLLDESLEQTRRILDAQAEEAARMPVGVDAERDHRHKVWQEAMRLIQPYDIVVPQAKSIAAGMPAGRVRARRDLPKVLGLAGAIAMLFQRQRQPVNGCLFTTDGDIELALRLTEVLRSPVPAKLKKMADQLKQAFGTAEFTPNEASKVLGYADSSTMAKHLKRLLEHDLVELATAQAGNSPGRWRVLAPPLLPSMVGGSKSPPPPGGFSPPTGAVAPAIQRPTLPWPVPVPPMVPIIPAHLPAQLEHGMPADTSQAGTAPTSTLDSDAMANGTTSVVPPLPEAPFDGLSDAARSKMAGRIPTSRVHGDMQVPKLPLDLWLGKRTKE